MAREFRFLDDVALADTAYEATGDSLSELFEAAAEALIEAMVDPNTVGMQWKRVLSLEQDEVSELLFDWLSTLVFLKDAEAVVFHHVQAEVWKNSIDGKWHVRGEVVGDEINPGSQELRADVKAVTKHLFDVSQRNHGWVARVVLDV